MPAKDVKAYVKRNKNDAADAEAICEAVRRPTMRFVRIKSAEQQGQLMLHRARDLLIIARGRAEKLASSRWPQPVANTRSWFDIQRRDRGHRQADRPSAHNRRRLNRLRVTKIWR
jgi:transposase